MITRIRLFARAKFRDAAIDSGMQIGRTATEMPPAADMNFV